MLSNFYLNKEKYNIHELINLISEELSDLRSNHLQEVWWIIEEVTNKTQAELIAHQEIYLTEDQKQKIENIIEKLDRHIPFQYVIGYVPFLDLKIFVETPILIPRPETEYLCEQLIEKLKNLANKKIRILDIGTGSGCIALSLAHAFPQAQVFAVDISDQALELAKKNAEYNKIKNITFIKSDLFSEIKNFNIGGRSNLKFANDINEEGVDWDLIVSNPPYISEKDYENLEESVKNWEDKKALMAQDDGLAIIKKIIKNAPNFINKNEEFINQNLPQLVLEIGYNQGEMVKQLMQDVGFKNIKIIKDLSGRDRIMEAGL